MTTKDIINGTCNCGNIKISVPKSAFPEFSVICHCASCRASSGLFSTNLVIDSDKITTTGNPRKYPDKDTDSGNTAERTFCGDCGSAVYTIVKEAPQTAYVKAGMFVKTGQEIPAPAMELYWKRAEKWEKKAEGAKVMD